MNIKLLCNILHLLLNKIIKYLLFLLIEVMFFIDVDCLINGLLEMFL